MADKKTEESVGSEENKNEETHGKNGKNGTNEVITKQMKGFAKFLGKYSIVTLAIGTIIGQTTRDVVNKLVSGIITPLLSHIFQNVLKVDKIQELTFEVGENSILIGEFISAMIEMFIILFIIYFTVVIVFRKRELIDKKK